MTEEEIKEREEERKAERIMFNKTLKWGLVAGCFVLVGILIKFCRNRRRCCEGRGKARQQRQPQMQQQPMAYAPQPVNPYAQPVQPVRARMEQPLPSNNNNSAVGDYIRYHENEILRLRGMQKHTQTRREAPITESF